MAETRRTKDSKRRVNNFKKQVKQKRMTENQQAANMPQLPEVREVPYWLPTDSISLTGLEFERLFNGIQDLTMLVQGISNIGNSIMQRNIFDGTIKVRFEKLVSTTDADGNFNPEYEVMSDEEQVPHQEAFAKFLNELKEKRNNPSIPRLDALVNQDGETFEEKTTEILDANGTVAVPDIKVSSN